MKRVALITIALLASSIAISYGFYANSSNDQLSAAISNPHSLSAGEMELVYILNKHGESDNSPDYLEHWPCAARLLEKRKLLTIGGGKGANITHDQWKNLRTIYASIHSHKWELGAGLASLDGYYPVELDHGSDYEKPFQALEEMDLVYPLKPDSLFLSRKYARTTKGRMAAGRFGCKD